MCCRPVRKTREIDSHPGGLQALPGPTHLPFEVATSNCARSFTARSIARRLSCALPNGTRLATGRNWPICESALRNLDLRVHAAAVLSCDLRMPCIPGSLSWPCTRSRSARGLGNGPARGPSYMPSPDSRPAPDLWRHARMRCRWQERQHLDLCCAGL